MFRIPVPYNIRILFIAFLLLSAMALLAFFSMKQDSLTFDELAHIPAGYSYLTQQDYRLNPEHPPLAKDIAALPLVFLNLNFPTESQNWQQDSGAPPWWVQFDMGNEFIYKSGNNAREIIVWSRLPMIGLLLLLGAFLFFWAKKLVGPIGALVALTLFAFSPTLLAHGRLVTTDVAAAFGFLIAIFFWLEFLKHPSLGRILATSLALGIAFLLKFNTILLIPFFAVITVLYVLLFYPHRKRRELARYIVLSCGTGVIALILVVWPVYAFHTASYPADRQLRDTHADLQADGLTFYENALGIELAKNEFTRPLAQYFRGVLMAAQRGQFGNTTYFMGEMSAKARADYFPILFLTKVPLAFHVLFFVGLIGILYSIKKKLYQGIVAGAASWSKHNFPILAIGLFVSAYWAIAVSGNLNIGIRHVLVTFPFIYLLSAWGIKELTDRLPAPYIRFANIGGVLVLAAYITSSALAFPHFISYYNVLAKGTDQGYNIAVDSNYDWGQDFYRLQEKIEEHNIKTLTLHYFGGENPEYWLANTFVPYHPCKENCSPEDYPTGWFAVSINELMGGIATPAPGFDQHTGYYNWLLQYEPVDRAGTSILLYRLP